jgi:hypothetical protein
MRSIIAFGLAAFAIGTFVTPATAAKTKMGCEIGKEIWDASAGKCVPGTYTKKSAGKTAAKKKPPQ